MKKNSFSKSQRILTPDEYKLVFNKPIKKIHSDHLLLFVQKNNTKKPRLGLAITKKKLKHAVMRNWTKRLAREYFRHVALEIGSVDVVLIVKKSFTKECDIHGELNHLFGKLRTYHPAS
ncbi:ribonuclease P protein component [Moraxella nasovis]|uniref:ribonuclease P protein component n=1 Tax=Moraxella nasovis TaxID=2904121 RepID=UPI001F615A49|nr:ribonuclease P protein component [Moraxella nasovis]UNU72494.1 ribonuclease P protein component [Moraxella nasovis]